jgi:hypothetical protein
VYYSANENAFLAAGREDEGPLTTDQVSGRISYSVSSTGVARFRDETGVFIRTSSFRGSAGVRFGFGGLNVTEVPAHPDIGLEAGDDQQWVERTTILTPNGKVKVVETKHGIGGPYDPEAQAKQWWRKASQAVEEETGERPTYNELKAMIQSREVLLWVNLGPLGQE